MDQLLTTETLVIELLLIVSLVAVLVRRLRLPYTVALVVAGLLITFQQNFTIDLTPELILALFVPPLVFEAAFHLEWQQLRAQALPILALAVPGVLLTTAIVGGIVSLGAGLGLGSAVVFGALIAATDPVAVTALFRSLGVPKRLEVLVEGESLLNDGTAIVVFQLALAATLASGTQASFASTFGLALFDFLRVSVVGLGIGAGLGWAVAWLIGRIDDYLIEITLTTVLAFGSYLLAERAHVSGVLAVVAAGVVCGTRGPAGMSPTTRIVLFSCWEYVAFVVNSLVFLLIGLDVNLPQLAARIVPISVAVLGVLVSRGVVIYGLCGLLNLRRRRVSLADQHVLFWGGLRGAIGLALALSLPASFADRETLRVMAFGVVLFTLLVQGTSMRALLQALGLVARAPAELEYERRHGRLLALQAARERIAHLAQVGVYSQATCARLGAELDTQIRAAHQQQETLLEQQPTLRSEDLEDARQESLRAQRATLTTLLGHGVLSETVYAELLSEVDAALLQPPPVAQPASDQSADGS